jgi:hypothetical protein
VSPGGPISASGLGHGSFVDSKTGTTLTCASTTSAGTLESGSGLSGQDIGRLTSIAFSGCTGPAGLTLTVETSASQAEASEQSSESYDASDGVTTETISNISGTITGPGCSATVNGTSTDGNNGVVAGSYSNETGTMTLSTSGSNLHIYNVSGCLGLIASGDPAALTGSYKISPAQAITSP